MVVGRPARELAPFDWLELAAREFQRLFSRCGAGREADDREIRHRADEACDPATLMSLRKPPTSLHAHKCAATRNRSGARANASSANGRAALLRRSLKR